MTVVGAALALASCSDDAGVDDATSGDEAAVDGTVLSSADVIPADAVGSITLTLVAEPGEADELLELFSDELGVGFETAPAGSGEPGRIDVTFVSVTGAEAETIRSSFVNPSLQVRPVLDGSACDPGETADAAPDPMLLIDRDGAPICVGAPITDMAVFTEPQLFEDADSGVSVSMTVTDEARTAWQTAASECFQALPTCPSSGPGLRGRLAVVHDGEILIAPQVNSPELPDSVVVTGDFTLEEAQDLVATITRDAWPSNADPDSPVVWRPD